MPFCPNCKSEYVDGIQTCSDCGAYLVDRLEAVPSHPTYMEPVRIITVTTSIEAANAVAVLDSCGIQAYSKIKGAAGYLKFYLGSVLYGEVDVYVPVDQLEQATEALESAGMLGEWEPVPDDDEDGLPAEDPEQEAPSKPHQNEDAKGLLPDSMIRRVFRKVALVGVILFALASLIRLIVAIVALLGGY